MSWDPKYCEPNGCQATHLPCEAAKAARFAGGETTHHLAPMGRSMKCIYCKKTQAEIETEAKTDA